MFGLDKTASVDMLIAQSGDTISSSISGYVTANAQGEIFIEMSGRDTNRKGFIQHRPYIYSIVGSAAEGIETVGTLPISISGSPLSHSGNMNLYMLGKDRAKVYNTISMHTPSNNLSSGNMTLFTSGVQAISSSGSFAMHTSGTFVMSSDINLAIRGK